MSSALGFFSSAESQQDQQEPFRLRVPVDVVNVDVSVTDARGNFVRHLQQKNFRILDEGAERPITNFAALEAPAVIFVLVEASPAVALIARQHTGATSALLDGLAAEDWVALGTYSDKLHLEQRLTQDKNAVRGALRSPRYGLGFAQLNLFESLGAAVDVVETVPGKKALILLSTGLDTSAPASWDALKEKLSAGETAIYAVALGGDFRSYRPKEAAASGELSFENADRALNEMAALTGGQVFFPKKAEEFPEIYHRVAATVRQRYSLGFAPARDARYHRIFVQLVDDRGRILGPFYPVEPGEPQPPEKKRNVKFRITTRRGYMAP